MTYQQTVPTALQSLGMGGDVIQRLLAANAAERKDDPARRTDLYGPYEVFTLLKTGRLPDDYFEENDAEPWGLLVEESRRNILWQVLSGVMDRQPDFAAAYMALALDSSLSDEDYGK